jgi:Endosomal/lysosomal potassium channel TMEM175
MSDTDEKTGIRMRGEAVTRLETFVDASFAFAVTLLVVSFNDLPNSMPELYEAIRRAPGFLASFAILAMFWVSHNRFSRRFALEDAWATLLSFAFVALCLLYVYPLRMIMALAMHYLTGGWAPQQLDIQSAEDLRGVYLLYGLGFGGMSIIIGLLNVHALRRKSDLGLNPLEIFLARAEVTGSVLLCIPAFISIILALTLTKNAMGTAAQGLPGMVYALLGIIMPTYGAWIGRNIKRISCLPRLSVAAGDHTGQLR